MKNEQNKTKNWDENLINEHPPWYKTIKGRSTTSITNYITDYQCHKTSLHIAQTYMHVLTHACKQACTNTLACMHTHAHTHTCKHTVLPPDWPGRHWSWRCHEVQLWSAHSGVHRTQPGTQPQEQTATSQLLPSAALSDIPVIWQIHKNHQLLHQTHVTW